MLIKLIFLAALASLIPAEAMVCEEICECACDKNSLKIRGAAFYPQGSLTRKIYDRFWPEGSLEYDYLWHRHYSTFVNGGFTRKTGHSIGRHHKTIIDLAPATLGLNVWLDNLCSWRPYIGVGVGAAYAHFHDFSPYVKQVQNKWGFASIVQIGMEVDFCESFFFDAFADYRFNWFDFNRRGKNLTGGADLGAGLGFHF